MHIMRARGWRIVMLYWPISNKITPLTPGQQYGCAIANLVTVTNMKTKMTWIHKERTIQPQQCKTQINLNKMLILRDIL